MENIKQPLIKKIAEAKAEIAELGIDFDTAKSIWDAQPSIDDLDALREFYSSKANTDALTAYRLYLDIEAYQVTMDLPLAKVETRYVITDGTLISPAGFYLDSGVYVKNNVWIETDRLPRSLSGLKAYDVQKDKEAA